MGIFSEGEGVPCLFSKNAFVSYYTCDRKVGRKQKFTQQPQVLSEKVLQNGHLYFCSNKMPCRLKMIILYYWGRLEVPLG